ncbi:MAG: beta-lactamase family protein [Chloroflexi bacterium]|nr:beta-lactamase family protein [Chloroflexota bacterium]
MKRVIVLALTLLLFTLPALAQEPLDAEALKTEIERLREEGGAPGLAVAVVYDGEVIFSEGFGVRNTETNDPVTADTLFRIGSTTKPLTAIGLLMLVEQGLLDLDAPVSSIVPEFQAGDDITVRHLLSHMSGLSDNAEPYGRLDPEALRDYVAALGEGARFAPAGEVLSYSNPGFDVAGRVIEVVSGQHYADYMADKVFPALEMRRTTLYPNLAMTYPLAVGYSRGLLGNAPVRPMVDNVAEYPAGFIFSSVNDLTRLAQVVLDKGMLDGEPILSAELAAEMQTPAAMLGTTGYGLGLIVGDYQGVRTLGHDGAINGYSSYFNTIPEYGLGVIVLASVDGFDALPIFEEIADLLLDLPKSTMAAGPSLPAEALAEYAGEYVLSDIYGGEVASIRIAVEEEDLVATVTGQPPLQLVPAAADVFEIAFGGVQVGQQAIFVRDAAGAVQYLNVGFRAAARVE